MLLQFGLVIISLHLLLLKLDLQAVSSQDYRMSAPVFDVIQIECVVSQMQVSDCQCAMSTAGTCTPLCPACLGLHMQVVA